MSAVKPPTLRDVLEWVGNHKGKRVDGDGCFGAQGPDLVNAYLDELFDLGNSHGNGGNKARCIVEAYSRYGWEYVPGSRGARLGDVGEMEVPGGVGQCFIVVGMGEGIVYGFQQNPGPAAVHTIPASAVTGYARPTLSI